MEKNYYDLLEVSKEASPEVIEKVYKLLAKKYHPDLQPTEKKAEAEEMIKKINTAYETLSNPVSRAKYDAKLAAENPLSKISPEDYKKLKQEKELLARELTQFKNYYNSTTVRSQVSPTGKSTSSNSRSSSYKKPSYSLKHKFFHFPTKDKLLPILLTIIIVPLVFFMLSVIPYTRNYFLNLYNNSFIIKNIVDIVITIVQSLWNTIISLFKS